MSVKLLSFKYRIPSSSSESDSMMNSGCFCLAGFFNFSSTSFTSSDLRNKWMNRNHRIRKFRKVTKPLDFHDIFDKSNFSSLYGLNMNRSVFWVGEVHVALEVAFFQMSGNSKIFFIVFLAIFFGSFLIICWDLQRGDIIVFEFSSREYCEYEGIKFAGKMVDQVFFVFFWMSHRFWEYKSAWNELLFFWAKKSFSSKRFQTKNWIFQALCSFPTMLNPNRTQQEESSQSNLSFFEDHVKMVRGNHSVLFLLVLSSCVFF